MPAPKAGREAGATADEGHRLLEPRPSPVPLNVFQRLARGWERVHPYNAAQAMKVLRPIDPAAAASAWQDALTATGLGRVQVSGRGFHHVVLNGELARYPVAVVPAGVPLADYLSVQLNRPFDDPMEPPFRPFLAPSGDGPEGTYLGVTYQHWVADSVAIRLLLREWFVRLCDPTRARATPLAHPPSGYWSLFGPSRAGWRARDTLWSVFRRHLKCRRARKVKTFGPLDYPVGVLLRDAPAGLVGQLLDWSRARGVKLNDLFLTAAAQACHSHVPAQARPNRKDLAIGSIVDLRPHARHDLGDTFGLFLGFTEVVCRLPDLRNFPRLIRSVAAQNRQHRRLGVPQSSLGSLMVAVLAGRFVPQHELYHFYRKETPLIAGVSNVNLNHTWVAEYCDGSAATVGEYLRVSPTGPLAPVVFTLTTLGDRLHLSLTYRRALFTEAAAAELAGSFIERLASVVG